MKRIFYLVLWIILGLILSFIFHAIIEIIYLNWAKKNDLAVNWVLNNTCALPLWLIFLLPIFGIIFGLWCGLISWQKIYKKSSFSRDKLRTNILNVRLERNPNAKTISSQI